MRREGRSRRVAQGVICDASMISACDLRLLCWELTVESRFNPDKGLRATGNVREVNGGDG